MIDITIQSITQFFEIKIDNNALVNTNKFNMIIIIMSLNKKFFLKFF